MAIVRLGVACLLSAVLGTVGLAVAGSLPHPTGHVKYGGTTYRFAGKLGGCLKGRRGSFAAIVGSSEANRLDVGVGRIKDGTYAIRYSDRNPGIAVVRWVRAKHRFALDSGRVTLVNVASGRPTGTFSGKARDLDSGVAVGTARGSFRCPFLALHG